MVIYRFAICRRDRFRTFAGSFSEWSLNVAQIVSPPRGSGVCRQCGRNKLTCGRSPHELLSAAQPGNEQHPISDGRFQLQRQSGSQRRPTPIQLELRTVFLAAGILGQFHWRCNRYAAGRRHVYIQCYCVGFIEEQCYRSADADGGGSRDFAHADTDIDTDIDADTNTDANANTNTNIDTDANIDTDTNIDTNIDTNTRAHGFRYGYGAICLPGHYKVRYLLSGE